MPRNYYDQGTYNLICDRCSQKYKRSECKFEWNGFLTCYNCWDPKHPWLEPLPSPVDGLGVPDSRPRLEGTDVVNLNDTTGNIPDENNFLDFPGYIGRNRWADGTPVSYLWEEMNILWGDADNNWEDPYIQPKGGLHFKWNEFHYKWGSF